MRSTATRAISHSLNPLERYRNWRRVRAGNRDHPLSAAIAALSMNLRPLSPENGSPHRIRAVFRAFPSAARAVFCRMFLFGSR